MDVIPPLTADRISSAAPYAIRPDMLTSSTASEPGPGETAWTSGASFAAGERAIVGAPSSTVTISIATPGVVTWNGNGLPDGTPVILTTTGDLPTGLTAGAVYYVVGRAENSFKLAADPDGAPIATSGSQSGTHTATAHVHRTFRSVVGSNTGNPPAIDDGTKWIDVGPTNAWAMFDLIRTVQTISASPLVVTLTPGERVSAAGLDGVLADEATIEVIQGGETVYSYSQELLWRPTTSWSSYFFGKFRQRTSIGRTDLPQYADAQIRITLTRAAGDARCGAAVVGQHVYIGNLEYRAESDALNFSSFDRAETTGEAQLTRRRSVPKIAGAVRAPKSLVDVVRNARIELDAVPALWLGVSDPDHAYYGAFAMLGVYRRWLQVFDQPGHILQQLEVEGP